MVRTDHLIRVKRETFCMVGWLLWIGVFLLVGCQPTEPTLDSYTAPPTVLIDGQTWERQESIQTEEHELLDECMEQNPGFAECDELAGELVLYANDENLRFYWLWPQADGLHWLMLEFLEGEFITSDDGVGVPFEEGE